PATLRARRELAHECGRDRELAAEPEARNDARREQRLKRWRERGEQTSDREDDERHREDGAPAVAIRESARCGRADEHADEGRARDKADTGRVQLELAADRRQEEAQHQNVHRVEHPPEAGQNQQTPVEAVERHAIKPRDERLRRGAQVPRHPSAARSSALRTEAPAAPRIVLWVNTTYLMPLAGASRTRTTIDAQPRAVTRARL